MLSFLLLFVVLIKLIVIIVVLQIEFQDSLGKALLIYEFVVVVQKKKGDRGGGGGVENTSNTKSVNRSKPNDKMCICVCECVYVAHSKEKCTISFFLFLNIDECWKPAMINSLINQIAFEALTVYIRNISDVSSFI